MTGMCKIAMIIFGIAALLLAMQFIPVQPPPKDDPGYFWWSGVLAVVGGCVGLIGFVQSLVRREQRLLSALPLVLNAGLVGTFILFFL
jgi:O-antigen/teichoic acid export membrane protein